MSLSRTHIAFLGIISIFTGMIAPGARSGDILLSYLMTDARWIVYFILFGLILAFTLAALRAWRFYRITASLIIIALLSLIIMTLTGSIGASRGGAEIDGFSWGWIFLSIGILLLLWSYRRIESGDEDSAFSETIDTIIGMMGGFALASIAGVIILSSLSFFTRGEDDHEILSRMFGSGEIKMLSGEIRSYGNYISRPTLAYDRGKDFLLLSHETASGKVWTYRSGGIIQTGSLKNDESVFYLNDSIYTLDASGHARTSSGRVILGSKTTPEKNAIIYKNDGILEYITEKGIKNMSYTGLISSPISISKDASTLVWAELRGEKKHIVKNGDRSKNGHNTIDELSISANGQNITILASSGSDIYIIRNDIVLGVLPKNTLTGSYRSNGAHTIYAIDDNGTKNIQFDSGLISRNLQDVREIFLERDGGGSYAYFARPIGEEKWCLFTRYKGNLCGLEGYMNPRVGADGSSILFAGRKNGIWNIYRNTDTVVYDTGYSPNSVEYDYAFYDQTNPRTYLFIEYDALTKKYQYRKNGRLLPGSWDDVSTEVVFGYDNHILTSAKQGQKWNIIEL